MGAVVKWRHASSHELMPVYHRIADLLHNQWTTRASLITDADGRVTLRAFYGDYALRYTVGGRMPHGVRFTVDRQSAMPLTMRVPFA